MAQTLNNWDDIPLPKHSTVGKHLIENLKKSTNGEEISAEETIGSLAVAIIELEALIRQVVELKIPKIRL